MDDLDDFEDALLKHAVRGGIGDHQAGEVVLVLLSFCAEIFNIDFTVLGSLHHHDLVAGLGRRCGVGAMCRRRDQADVAVTFATAEVVVANHGHTGIFTGGTGVRL